jgi:uncharacterized protein
MRALITGATGFIGRRLAGRLQRPVVLSRRPARARELLGDVQAYAWEPEAAPPPAEALREVDVVFHLAGEPVAAGRWTAARRARIRSSRVESTRNLVAALEASPARPRVLVAASAVGFYGSRGDEVLDESSPPGDGFLAGVCAAWEAAALRAQALGVRVVTPRIGIVLGKGGGALARMIPPFKLGLGGPLAGGRHWMSWIHLDDLVGILLHAAHSEDLRGAVNAVGPGPVTNLQFTRALAAALHRPAIFPVPRFALRLMFGELASELLASQRAVPSVAEKTGFRFQYSTVEQALGAAIAGEPRGS